MVQAVFPASLRSASENSPTATGLKRDFEMANHVSSLKRARQTETKTAVNRANKSKLRGTLRSLREAIAKGDAKELKAAYSSTVSVLDKSVQKGVIHKNTASRYKSRLNARVKAATTQKVA
jgi:small subunit ribosomal protein S20